MILRLGEFRFPDSQARLYGGTRTDGDVVHDVPAEPPSADWVLEIGFGDGRFWAEHGPTEPHVDYLGVELSGASLLKAQRRLRAAGLTRAHLTRMPAMTLLRGVIPPRGLARIVVNFPDPWPKVGHEEYRLLRDEFFELAASRLRSGGEIWITTDHDEYFEFALAHAERTRAFEPVEAEPPAAALRTKYALKWQELGLGVHHARLRVREHPDVPGLAVEQPDPTEHQGEPDTVPHAIVTLPADFDLTDFEKTVTRTEAHTVVLLDAYRHTRRDQWALLAHVEEQDLTQEALVSVTRREDGSCLVRLERFGGPIVTAGLKSAVGAVTDLLEGRGASVTLRSY